MFSPVIQVETSVAKQEEFLTVCCRNDSLSVALVFLTEYEGARELVDRRIESNVWFVE